MNKRLQVATPMTLRQFDAAMETLLDRERRTPQVFGVVTSSRLGRLRKARGAYTVDEHKEFADHTLVAELNVILSKIPCCVALDVLDDVADAEYLEEHPEVLLQDAEAEESITTSH